MVENNDNNKKWNVASLKEYFERQFNLFENNINLRFESTKEAVLKAELEMNRRLNSMNEFREQLKDQGFTFLTRAEYDLMHKALNEKVLNISKLVYIGLGIWLVVQIIISAIIFYELNR